MILEEDELGTMCSDIQDVVGAGTVQTIRYRQSIEASSDIKRRRQFLSLDPIHDFQKRTTLPWNDGTKLRKITARLLE